MIFTTEHQEEERIRTYRSNGKEGVVMLKSDYDTIRFLILSTLHGKQHITINELLENCKQRYTNHHVDVCWFILQVKLDLDAQGLIKSFVPVGQRGITFIKLTRSGKVKFHLELVLKEIRLTRQIE